MLDELKLWNSAHCKILVLNILKWGDLEQMSQAQDIPWFC